MKLINNGLLTFKSPKKSVNLNWRALVYSKENMEMITHAITKVQKICYTITFVSEVITVAENQHPLT